MLQKSTSVRIILNMSGNLSLLNFPGNCVTHLRDRQTDRQRQTDTDTQTDTHTDTETKSKKE